MNVYAEKIAEELFRKIDSKAKNKLLHNTERVTDIVIETTYFSLLRKLSDKIDTEKLRELFDSVETALKKKLDERQKALENKILQNTLEKSTKYLVIVSDDLNFFESALDLYASWVEGHALLIVGDADFGEHIADIGFYYIARSKGALKHLVRGTIKLYTEPHHRDVITITGVRKTYSIMITKKLTERIETPIKAYLKGKEYTLHTVRNLYNLLFYAAETLKPTRTKVKNPVIFVDTNKITETIRKKIKEEIATEKSKILDLILKYEKIGKLLEAL